MFIVGMLMIAMLVGFGATAAAPAEFEDGLAIGTRAMEPEPETDCDDDTPGCHPMFDPPITSYPGFGGLISDCPCPSPVGPSAIIGGSTDLM